MVVASLPFRPLLDWTRQLSIAVLRDYTRIKVGKNRRDAEYLSRVLE